MEFQGFRSIKFPSCTELKVISFWHNVAAFHSPGSRRADLGWQLRVVSFSEHPCLRKLHQMNLQVTSWYQEEIVQQP